MRRSLECDVVAVALQILASGFAAGAVYGLVAAGQSVVFRLTGVVNFAFGELIALGVFVTLLVAAGSGPISQTSVGGGRFLLALVVGLAGDRGGERRFVLPRDRAVPGARLGDRLGRRVARRRLRRADTPARLLRPSRLCLPRPAAVRGLAHRRRHDPAALARGGSGRRRAGGARGGGAAANALRPRPRGDRPGLRCRRPRRAAGGPPRGHRVRPRRSLGRPRGDSRCALRRVQRGHGRAARSLRARRSGRRLVRAAPGVRRRRRSSASSRRRSRRCTGAVRPHTATSCRSRSGSCCSPGARARPPRRSNDDAQRVSRRGSRRTRRLAAAHDHSSPSRSASRRSRRSSSANRASPTWRAASTSPPPRSASRSLSASRACRCSHRERSWRSAPSRPRTSARPHSAQPRARWPVVSAGAVVGSRVRAPARRPGSRSRPGSSRGSSPSACSRSGWPLGGTRGNRRRRRPVAGPSTTSSRSCSPSWRCSSTRTRAGAARAAARRGARARAGSDGAAGSDRAAADRALGVSGTVAGLAGALAVHLAGVGDPGSFSPFLSFKLFVVVLIGGPLSALGGRRRRARARRAVGRRRTRSARSNTSPPRVRTRCSRRSCCSASSRSAGTASCGPDAQAPLRRRARGPTAARRRASRRAGSPSGTATSPRPTNIDLDVEAGRITALVGPNGSGKTTVLRMLAGRVAPDSGRIDVGRGTAVRTLQATAVFSSQTPLEHLLAASAGRRRRGGLARSLFATPQMRGRGCRIRRPGARRCSTASGSRATRPAGELPVSDQRALMLATAYATGASVLLVDEPTAGASHLEAERIADLLSSLRGEGLALARRRAQYGPRAADRRPGARPRSRAGCEPPACARLALLALVALLAGCGSSTQSSPRKQLLVVVNAPFSRTPYLGQTIENGARLAASEVNAGGLRVDGTTYDLKVQTKDSALSPARALANVRSAANEHAIAVVDEGTGIDASWRVAKRDAHRHRLPGRQGAGRPGDAAERLPDRAHRPRDCVPAGGVHDPEGAEDRAAPRRLRLRLGRRRSPARGVLGERIVGRPRRDRCRPTRSTSPRRSCAPGAPVRQRSSCGGSRPRSRPRSPPRAPPAGTCRSSPRRPVTTRSSVSNWPITRPGSTGSRSRAAG